MSRATLLFIAAAGVLAACHSRSVSKPQAVPAAVPAAPAAGAARDSEVRPLSRPIGSSVAVAEIDHRHLAVVADEEESAIQIVDLDTQKIVTTKKLDGAPGQLVFAPSGTLFVAVRGAGHVVGLRFREGGALDEVARGDTGDEPFGLALTPDASTVLVTSIGGSRLEAHRATDLAPAFVAPLPRDPRSIAVTKDGARAFVSHATGSVFSVVDLGGTAAARSVTLDERERRRDFGEAHISKPPSPSKFGPAKSMRFPPAVRISMKRTATQGFALAMIGEKVFLPETLVMTSDTNEIPTGYGSVAQSTLGTHVPFVARARITDEAIENPELSGPADRTCFEAQPECIVPRAMTHDETNLYVACLDSSEVLVIDPAADAEHAPACKKALQQRTRVKVESPTGLALDGDRKSIVVFSSFSRRLSVVALDRPQDVTAIELPRITPLPELVTEGRKLFHRSAEPRIAKNGRACASCHVDGRDDALVWPTPLGKRQTPMLAGRIDGTAPYGWNGEHATLVTHIKSTVKNLEGTGLADREVEALAAYVTSMHAPPKRTHGTDAVARGKTLFDSNETGCSSCHVATFTDHETHALGKDRAARFDTPSLAFVGQTAPYFHDGRFKTLEELIDGCDGVMGRTKHLSADNRQDLVQYLRSL